MYSATRLVAAMNLRHGDPVVRVQRLALAVAMMLSSSNVSPVTTILASLLFAVLAGWARAHVWTRARKTLGWSAGTPLAPPCGQIGYRDAVAGQDRTPPTAGKPMTDLRRLCAAICHRMPGDIAPPQRVTLG